MHLRDPQVLARRMAFEGLSNRRLAELVGWRSHTYVGRLLRGKARSVTPESAERLAKVLGCRVEALFLPSGASDRVASDSEAA
jgi:transcriptional regulator with XRE-family HTH domain